MLFRFGISASSVSLIGGVGSMYEDGGPRRKGMQIQSDRRVNLLFFSDFTSNMVMFADKYGKLVIEYERKFRWYEKVLETVNKTHKQLFLGKHD